jgi:hypothetical protein
VKSVFQFFFLEAGKVTTDEELEEILHSENPAIFTSDVSGMFLEHSCITLHK